MDSDEYLRLEMRVSVHIPKGSYDWTHLIGEGDSQEHLQRAR